MLRPLTVALLVVGAQAGQGSRAAPAGPAPRPRSATVLYIADLGGTLEPCGCSLEQRGGLPRLAAAVARVRKEVPGALLVAGGDLLFEGPIAPERREEALVKARAAAASLKRMGLAAAIPGERDLAAGKAFLAETGLPFAPSARLREGGGQFEVEVEVAFGLAGSVPPGPVRIGVVQKGGTAAALGSADEARRQGVTLLLAAHRASLVEDDVNRAVLGAPVPVAQVQGRGQSLLRVDFRLAGDLSRGFAVLEGPAQRAEELDLLEQRVLDYRRRMGAARADGREDLARALSAKIAELERRAAELRAAPLPTPPSDRPSLTVSFVPIGSGLPEDREVRRILTRAYGEIARRNLADARARGKPCPDPAADRAAYVGTDLAPPGGKSACKDCHPAAFAQWRTTAHARAYATLAKRDRQYDLECIGCHVTGWLEPGGACSVAEVEGRKDVQCESCHGPASLHAVDPPGHLRRDPGEATCVGCHTSEHSTRFELRAYRSRILGPGHGAPSP